MIFFLTDHTMNSCKSEIRAGIGRQFPDRIPWQPHYHDRNESIFPQVRFKIRGSLYLLAVFEEMKNIYLEPGSANHCSTRAYNHNTKEGESRFQTAFEYATVGISIVSPEGRWLRVNRKLCAILGYTQDELMALTFRDVTYPDDLKKDSDNTRHLLGGEVSTFSMEKRYIRKDGGVIWANLQVSLVRKADNTPDYFISVIEDIQRRKKAEIALQESREQLKLFIEYAPAALAMVDHEMRYLACSQRWRSDYGLHGRDLLGVSHYEIFPEISEEWKAIHRRCLAGETIRAEEDRFVRADGSVQWLRWEVRPWYQGGAISGIAMFAEDITSRKQSEMALQQLNIDLEERIANRTAELKTLNQSLEGFVYSVSHDLKAPLRGIEGYSRLLEEDYTDRLDDEGRLFVRNIRTGVRRMNELIDDLLAYSRMERRHLESAVLDLSMLVKQEIEGFREEIAANGVEIIADLPPLLVNGDRDGLAMALRNLLENAIKFSRHAAHPRIEFGFVHDDEYITLWIRDNGIGFDMKYSERIFELFERLRRQETYPGTGIGLALIRKAVHRMGGEIRAQSTPGEGATFHLRLPRALEKTATVMEP